MSRASAGFRVVTHVKLRKFAAARVRFITSPFPVIYMTVSFPFAAPNIIRTRLLVKPSCLLMLSVVKDDKRQAPLLSIFGMY
jgi:hypothetical protein